MQNAGTPWSEGEITLLRKLWADGLSATECSKKLPGRTRNACIGEVHRLGLPKRATTASNRPPRWTPARRQASQCRFVTTVALRKPKPEKPRKLDLPPTDPSIRAAAALFAISDDAQRRRDNYRKAGVMLGGWA